MVHEMMPKTRCYLTCVNTRKENYTAEVFVLQFAVTLCFPSSISTIFSPKTVSSRSVSNICAYKCFLYLWSFFAEDGIWTTCINTSFANCLSLLVVIIAWVFQRCADYRWTNICILELLVTLVLQFCVEAAQHGKRFSPIQFNTDNKEVGNTNIQCRSIIKREAIDLFLPRKRPVHSFTLMQRKRANTIFGDYL